MKFLQIAKIVGIFLISIVFFIISSTVEASSFDLWFDDVPSLEATNLEESVYRFNVSALYSTGIYANKGDTITVTGNNINICLGPPGRFEFKPDNEITKYSVNGERTIQVESDSTVLYIENISGMSEPVSISGGTSFPLFEKGKTNPIDFILSLSEDKNIRFVEFVGDHTILTIPNPGDYLTKLIQINLNYGLNNFVDYFDKVAIYGGEASGLNFVNENNLNYISGKIHYVKAEESLNNGMFNATHYRLSLHNTNGFNKILNEFTGTGKAPMMEAIWGLWHETGHVFQNDYLRWSGMGEVTVNIGSYYTMKKLGNPITELTEFTTLIPTVQAFLENSSQTKRYSDIENVFMKMGMFAQLMEAYGDDVFGKLNEEYRNSIALNELSSSNQYTDEGKQQLFMVYLSRVTKKDLSDFFKKWGLYPNVESFKEISQYDKPTVPIERNIFYDGTNYYDGDDTNFESLSVQVKNIPISKVQSGIDSISALELFDNDSLYSFPGGEKLTLKSYHVLYTTPDYLIVHIKSNEGPTGNYKVPITIDNIKYENMWRTVTWEFNQETGSLIFTSGGSLGTYAESPWNRTENAIDPKLIKHIKFSEPVKAPTNSSNLFSGSGSNQLSNLESFENISYLETTGVTDMNFMFAGTMNLTNLNLSGFDTSKVTSMYAMFHNSSNLMNLDVSNFDTSNVINMGFIFFKTSSLTSLDLSNFDMSNVAGMGYMFYGTSKLKEISLSKTFSDRGNTSNLPAITANNQYTGNWKKKDGEVVGTTADFLANFSTADAGMYVWEEIEPEIEPGDLNNDGRVGVLDLARLKVYINKRVVPSQFDEKLFLKAADMNNDGNISVIDVALLKIKVIG